MHISVCRVSSVRHQSLTLLQIDMHSTRLAPSNSRSGKIQEFLARPKCEVKEVAFIIIVVICLVCDLAAIWCWPLAIMYISKLVVCKPRVREIPPFVIKGYLLPFYFLHMLYLIIYKRQINRGCQLHFVFYYGVIPTRLGYLLICALNSFGTSSMSTNEWCTHFIVFWRDTNVVQWQCVLIWGGLSTLIWVIRERDLLLIFFSSGAMTQNFCSIIVHFLRTALSGSVYRCPRNWLIAGDCLFLYSFNVTEKSHSVFSYQRQRDDTAKELYWLVAHIKCNLFFAEKCSFWTTKTAKKKFEFQVSGRLCGDGSDWLLFIYSVENKEKWDWI